MDKDGQMPEVWCAETGIRDLGHGAQDSESVIQRRFSGVSDMGFGNPQPSTPAPAPCVAHFPVSAIGHVRQMNQIDKPEIRYPRSEVLGPESPISDRKMKSEHRQSAIKNGKLMSENKK